MVQSKGLEVKGFLALTAMSTYIFTGFMMWRATRRLMWMIWSKWW